MHTTLTAHVTVQQCSLINICCFHWQWCYNFRIKLTQFFTNLSTISNYTTNLNKFFFPSKFYYSLIFSSSKFSKSSVWGDVAYSPKLKVVLVVYMLINWKCNHNLLQKQQLCYPNINRVMYSDAPILTVFLPSIITDVVPSPTSSSCVLAISIMDLAAGCSTVICRMTINKKNANTVIVCVMTASQDMTRLQSLHRHTILTKHINTVVDVPSSTRWLAHETCTFLGATCRSWHGFAKTPRIPSPLCNPL